MVADLDTLEIERAWVGYLPSPFADDPAAGNAELYRSLAAHRARLDPAPAVNHARPGWRDEVAAAESEGAAAIRVYPAHWGLTTDSGALTELVICAGEAALPVIVTMQFEDIRQRAPADTVPGVDAATIRALARIDSRARIVVAAAGRAIIEEVHYGLTPEEAGRLWWEISHVWGPPEDHLAHLVGALGAERFLLGTHWPLRIRDAALAKLHLLDDGPAQAAIASRNLSVVVG